MLDPLEGHPRYERLEDINSGTFGFVTKAMDKYRICRLTDSINCECRENGTTVAIKFLPRGKRIPSYVEREIINHKALRHPHVIQFKEVFFTDKYLGIVMEYADQGDLFRYVRVKYNTWWAAM